MKRIKRQRQEPEGGQMPHTTDTRPVGIEVFRSVINVEVRVQLVDVARG